MDYRASDISRAAWGSGGWKGEVWEGLGNVTALGRKTTPTSAPQPSFTKLYSNPSVISMPGRGKLMVLHVNAAERVLSDQ